MKDHKIQTRKKNMKILRSFCLQPGCKFKGKEAAQGICFGKLKGFQHEYARDVMSRGENLLKEMKSLRKRNKKWSLKGWIGYLEGHLVCSWANSEFGLDELIRLRAENAKLRLALGKYK